MILQEKDMDGLSQALYAEKIKWGWSTFFKLKNKYNIINYEEIKGIVYFSINGNDYKFGLPSRQIALIGTNDWTTKHISYIKAAESQLK